MPSLEFNNYIRQVRKRKSLTQQLVADAGGQLSAKTISNIEIADQRAFPETMTKLLSNVEVEPGSFFYPYLTCLNSQVLSMRIHMMHCLVHAQDNSQYLAHVKELLALMEASDIFDDGINLQFLLNCKTTIMEIEGQPTDTIMPLVNQGINITYPEAEDTTFDTNVFVFYEIDLLHTKAKLYKNSGNLVAAKSILSAILKGFNKTPQDDRDKERKLAPVMLTFAECYLQEGDYDAALQICKDGHSISVKHNNGYHLPDFASHIATCLHHLHKASEAAPWARMAYFGYALQCRNTKANAHLAYAKATFGLTINTYGVHNLNRQLPQPKFNVGSSFIFKGPKLKIEEFGKMEGRMIAMFRTEAGLSLDQLCQGLCSNRARLNKIESGALRGNVFELEAIMQRLGRDIDYYFNTFPSKKDFENKQKRDKANAMLATRRFEEAEELLSQLQGEKYFTDYTNRQFLELANAILYKVKNGQLPKVYELLETALAVTRKDFDLRDVNKTRFTFYEITILNMMAIYLCNTGAVSKGLRLYEDLLESMSTFYVDDTAKVRRYTMVLNNYLTSMGKADRHNELYELIVECDTLCLLHSRMRTLVGVAANMGAYLLKSKKQDMEQSLAYIAMAYYCDMLFDNHNDVEIGAKYVKEHFGVELE